MAVMPTCSVCMASVTPIQGIAPNISRRMVMQYFGLQAQKKACLLSLSELPIDQRWLQQQLLQDCPAIEQGGMHACCAPKPILGCSLLSRKRLQHRHIIARCSTGNSRTELDGLSLNHAILICIQPASVQCFFSCKQRMVQCGDCQSQHVVCAGVTKPSTLIPDFPLKPEAILWEDAICQMFNPLKH